MRAGDLTERISLFRPYREQDSMGGHKTVLKRMADRWAVVRAPSARDGVMAMQGAEVRSHVVVVRDRPEPPKQDDIIVWRGVRLRVKARRHNVAASLVVLDCVEEKP